MKGYPGLLINLNYIGVKYHISLKTAQLHILTRHHDFSAHCEVVGVRNQTPHRLGLANKTLPLWSIAHQ